MSFCIPIYNVAPYIRDCIESIKRSGLEPCKYEVICIDDCSSDDSYNVLKMLAESIPQIKIFKNEKNAGVSYSRNFAMKIAAGKYIWFVDPDDAIVDNSAKILLNFAEKNNADVILGDFNRFNESDEIPCVLIDENEQCRLSDEPSRNEKGNGMSTVCGGLFLRRFLIDNKLSFNEKMITQEDALFFWQLKLCRPRKFKYNGVIYLYRQRRTSTQHSKNELRSMQCYKSMIEMLAVYESLDGSIDAEFKDKNTEMIHRSKENAIAFLTTVTNTSFVRKEIKKLKEQGVYPYPFRKEVFKANERLRIHSYLKFLLPIELAFWLEHFGYKIYFNIKYKRRGSSL